MSITVEINGDISHAQNSTEQQHAFYCAHTLPFGLQCELNSDTVNIKH